MKKKKNNDLDPNIKKVFITLLVIIVGIIAVISYKNSINSYLLKDPKGSAILKAQETNNLFIINGFNKKGETIYFFTDPNCPYCKVFEKKYLEKMLELVKEVNVVYNPLPIPGHEDSYKRAALVKLNLNNKMNSHEKITLMKKYSNMESSKIKEELKKYHSDDIDREINIIKSFTNYKLINSTPTIINEKKEDVSKKYSVE